GHGGDGAVAPRPEDQDHDRGRDRPAYAALILVGGEQGPDRRLAEDDDQRPAGHQAAPGERPALLRTRHEGRQRGGQDQVPVHRDPAQPHGAARPQQQRRRVVDARDQPVGDGGGGAKHDDEQDGGGGGA